MNKNISLNKQGDYICGRFTAMASPCELLFDTHNIDAVRPLFELALQETQRIEDKYSRYRAGNLMHAINNCAGKPVSIDHETYKLLEFANICYELSSGKFDVTSGILRRVWVFDGSANVPRKDDVEKLLPFISWQKVKFDHKQVLLPTGFEIDFGGIGKEYAVNRVAQLLNAKMPEVSILVNFGGDIQVTRPRLTQSFWQIGIENPTSNKAKAIVNIAHGGLATSGDANKFLCKNGSRYSHILDPTTGFPVAQAPRSITVASEQCIHAGLMATLSSLQGKDAEHFLNEQSLLHWCYR